MRSSLISVLKISYVFEEYVLGNPRFATCLTRHTGQQGLFLAYSRTHNLEAFFAVHQVPHPTSSTDIPIHSSVHGL
jgi:hypothetical protein